MATDPLSQWYDSLTVRVNLQADLGWAGMQDGYAQAGGEDEANPYQFLWWTLGSVLTEHCSTCLYLADNSPYDPPGSGGNELFQTPGDGRTDCGAGCKCSLEYGAGDQPNAWAWVTRLPASWRDQWPEGSEPGLLLPARSDAPLLAHQKQALDQFRQAVAVWDALRGDLPELPEMFAWGEPNEENTPEIEFGQLTHEQERALALAWQALMAWQVATDLGDGAGFSEPDADTMLLDQARDWHGRFAYQGGRQPREGEGEGEGGGGIHGSGAGGGSSGHDNAPSIERLRQVHVDAEAHARQMEDEAYHRSLEYHAVQQDLYANPSREADIRATAAWDAMHAANRDAAEARYDADIAHGQLSRAEHPVQSRYQPDLERLEAARTTDEVERWIRDTFPQMRAGFHGADVEAAKGVARELADLGARHPDAMSTLHYVGTESAPASAPYMAAHFGATATAEHEAGWMGSYEPSTRSMLLSDRVMADDARAQDLFDQQVARRWMAARPGTDAQRYVVAHEFGHHIEHWMAEHPDARIVRAHNHQFNAMAERHSASLISEYARMNRHERFAEGFAASRYGDDGHAYVSEMRRMLDALG